MTTYDIGDAPQVTARFYDQDDALTDPTTVTAKLVEPDGTQSDLAGISNPSVGVYTVSLPTIDQSGKHVVKFFGVGALVAAEEVAIEVRRTRVT